MSQIYTEIDWDAERAALEGVDAIVCAALNRDASIPFDRFRAHFGRIQGYSVDQTGFSPLMLYFLYQVGALAGTRDVVGCGVYSGLAFTLLALGARDAGGDGVRALGLDDDAANVSLARSNAERIQLGDWVSFSTEPGDAFLARRQEPIGLLMLDLHHPVRGKEDYTPLARRAAALMPPGAVLLAHDACVPRFKPAIDDLTTFVQGSGLFDGPWILPVDDTGILMAVRR